MLIYSWQDAVAAVPGPAPYTLSVCSLLWFSVSQYDKLHKSIDIYLLQINKPSFELVSREPKTVDMASFLHCVIICCFINIRATGRDSD